MLYRSTRRVLPLLLVGVSALGISFLSGCRGGEEPAVTGKYEVADEEESKGAVASSAAGQGRPSTKTGNSPQKPPTTAAVEFANYEVPKGGAEELVAFIEDLEGRSPSGTTQAEVLTDLERMQAAKIEAADKLLAGPEQDKETRRRAVEAKLGSLRILAEIGKPVETQIRQFSKELSQDQDADLARLGRVILFGIQLGEIAEKEDADYTPVMKELRALVAEEGAQEEVFAIGRQAAMVLQARGQNELAIEAFQLIGDTFANAENPQLVQFAEMMQDQARLLETDFDAKLEAVLMEQPDATQPLLDAAEQVLAAKDPGMAILQSTSQAAQTLEFSRHYGAAENMFAMIEQAYRDHQDAELAQQAAQLVDYGKRRVGLLGQPFQIEGRLMDGSPFDWDKYKGKVVLVDFWATWCTPCIREIPNIKQAYEKYRDKGFEVVGINLDDSDEQVQQFLATQDLPWETVRSGNPETDGMHNPLAVKAGVDAIPFVILVNREGYVESLHVRGPALEEELERLLGPAAQAQTSNEQGSQGAGQVSRSEGGASRSS